MRTVFALLICAVAGLPIGCARPCPAAPGLPLAASPAHPVEHASAALDKEQLRKYRLLFVKKADIYVCQGDGSGIRRIIERGETPVWSPDNSKIAFCRDEDVWIADADGTHQRRLTFIGTPTDMQANDLVGGPSVSIDWCPAPHRNVIDYSCGDSFEGPAVKGGEREAIFGSALYEIPADGSTKKPVTLVDIKESGTGFHFSQNEFPAWSRDGERMAFVRNGDLWYRKRAHIEREVKQPKNSKECFWDCGRLYAAASFDAPDWRGSRENEGITHISWAPDGQSLVYGVERLGGSGTSDIYLLHVNAREMAMEAAGEPQRIAHGFGPNYSSDGKLLTWWGQNKALTQFGVFVGDSQGRNPTLIVPDGVSPCWQH